MKRAVLTLLAALGVAAGLAVTASSTSSVAYHHGMRGLALGAIVVVLEVTNTLGTWVLLTDSRRHACVEAGVFVAAASLVTGWCGVLTYGPVGLVGSFFVLAGVELARLAATSPAQDDARGEQEPPAQPPSVAPPTGTEPDHAPTQPTGDEGGGPEAPTETPTPALSDAEIVAALLAQPVLPGRDAIKGEFRVGTKRADRVLELARDRRRPHLVSEATP